MQSFPLRERGLKLGEWTGGPVSDLSFSSWERGLKRVCKVLFSKSRSRSPRGNVEREIEEVLLSFLYNSNIGNPMKGG